ncbi:MAG: hypothetical protein JRE23_02675 [Deltaproteobacteria bacterium]|nr:hypothetical protein [Deltaproteobacteria bacterium]
MANKRNSDLVELTELANGDNITIRDVSDTTNQATGETKRSSWTSIKAFLKTYFDGIYADAGVNSDITSMTGLDNYGIPNVKIDNSVVSKTTTATLTVAEAGLVLVSASSPYTITLPTAVGNAGLTYHFKKTDANYNLITLDGNGTETFNYENADGVPKETYARLNTYCAEVTVVSDGSNWQVKDEALGQVPECLAYLSAQQLNIIHKTWTDVHLNAEFYDIGSNFNTGTYTFTAPIEGKYLISFKIAWSGASIIADTVYGGQTYDGVAAYNSHWAQAAIAGDVTNHVMSINSLSANDTVVLQAYVNHASADTVDIWGSGIGDTSMLIKLISKD